MRHPVPPELRTADEGQAACLVLLLHCTPLGYHCHAAAPGARKGMPATGGSVYPMVHATWVCWVTWSR